ncbi:uncharacterized protein [Mytilus edulis]|uniref:uncharacterized protein n=1 Tax=Mytilus edulis TaxID=6550 RepID=UPI0039F00CC7
MTNINQLYRIVLTVVFITESVCIVFPGQNLAQIPGQVIPGPFIPGQIPGPVVPGPFIPRQIIPRQELTRRDQLDQQQDLFLIEGSVTTVDGPGIATGRFPTGGFLSGGSALPFLPIPLLALGIPMMAMAMMTMMNPVTVTTTVAPAAMLTTPVTVTTPPAVVQPTPCVPQSCPAGYQLLDDQSASSNCYYTVKDETRSSYPALVECTKTQGASLWKPNSEAEANAVRSKFEIGTNTKIWTGAYKLGSSGYRFASDNSVFSFDNLPFGNKPGKYQSLRYTYRV